MAEQNNVPRRLFEDFPNVSTEAWEEVIHRDLKGADYAKKLIWQPLEGFEVRPYYRAEDLAKLPNTDITPGQFPFIRGNHAEGNPWLIRQDIEIGSFTEANATALDAILRGAESIGFCFKRCENPTADDLVTLLKGIDPLSTEINLRHAGRADHYFEPFLKAIETLGGNWPSAHGSIGFSQLTWLAMKGKLCQNHGGPWNRAAKAVEIRKRLPGMQTLSVDGRVFHNAGATAVQELAYTLAMAVEYMTKLTELDIAAEEVARTIRFNFAVGPLYFMEMAKLRAARLLWARIVEAYGVKDTEAAKMYIHAETSLWNQTVYDPYVNLLRGTTESMSAVLAGVHSLNVLPFNFSYEASNSFSERIARNTQILLRSESYFDKVADPAGGSYYVESLTASVAKAAWDLFQHVQEEGGFVAAFRAGTIQQAIKEIAATKRKRIATRRDTLLGTNQFPNFNETISPEIIATLGQETLGCKSDCCTTKTDPFEPLTPFRGAEDFEQLRFATDSATKRPKAFMLTLGNLAMRRARAQFSCNFFACAGIEVIDNIGFDSIEEGLNEARKAEAEIIVLCSSDDEYAELGVETFKQLESGEIFVIAGAPACQEDLEKLGIKHFISVKSNLLETLRLFQKELGIA